MAKTLQTATFLFTVFAAAVVVMAVEDYDVGGDSGWRRPSDPDFYTKWVNGKTFRVGDILEFEFAEAMHDVAVVTKEGYENCNTENPLSLLQTPPAKVTLNTTGPHYFICTVGDHCMFGQKLAVDVVGGTGGHGGAAASPGSTPSASGPSATTTPSAVAPPPNAAASLGGATNFLVALLSVAVALLY